MDEEQILVMARNIPNLECLNLYRCSLSDELLSQMLASLPRLRSLNISHSAYSLGDQAAIAISNHCFQLCHLSMAHSMITSSGIRLIAQQCYNLSSIDI